MAEVRPVDANALELSIRKTGQCERCKNQCLHRVSINKWDMYCKVIAQAPTIDYEPVIHAHWEDGAFENSKRCSACKRYASKVHSLYEPVFDYERCPYCGAHMDAKEDDNA